MTHQSDRQLITHARRIRLGAQSLSPHEAVGWQDRIAARQQALPSTERNSPAN